LFGITLEIDLKPFKLLVQPIIYLSYLNAIVYSRETLIININYLDEIKESVKRDIELSKVEH
jgi:hypothetical protein